MSLRLLLIVCVLLAEVAAAGESRLRDVIDRELSDAWRREQLEPAAPAEDAEFLRRVYLDLVGGIPTHDETVEFLDAADAAKRDKLIDRLLDDSRHAEHLTNVWDLMLFGRNPPGFDTDKRDGFRAWLREQFAENVPYDRWARALLKAEGNSIDDGPPVFYMQYKNQPEDATEAVTQLFLGVQLQCARCHDHPFEAWKQTDFYGMAAFLARLEVVTVGKENQLNKYAIGEKDVGDILFTGPAKDQAPGKKGDPIRPRFLLGAELDEPPIPKDYKEVKFAANKAPPAPKFSRKDRLAEWITTAENPYFARAIANRVWAMFYGRGLVHPVDNMSPANAPSHPRLLDELARELAAHDFDLKWFMRELVAAKAYQLSSAGGDGSQFPAWFVAARVRPLSAEELAQSWRTATGYEAIERSGGLKNAKSGRFRPFETSYMIRYFGTPNTGTGDFQGGLHEHLYLNNGPLGTVVATGQGGLLDAVQSDLKGSPEAAVARLYLSLLNRRPTSEEGRHVGAYLTGDADADVRCREAIWALMTSSEFRFNH